MTTLTGVVSTWPGRRWWGRISPAWIELAPDHVLFVLRRSDQGLQRVEVAPAEPRLTRIERDELGLILRRDFGVRLAVPCVFAGSSAGFVEVEARLRVLAGGAEWPRQLPSEALGLAPAPEASPDPVLAHLIGRLFSADIARVFAAQRYAELSLRLHDPALVEEVEAAVRGALSRPAEEDILALRGIELISVRSPLEDERWQAAALVQQAETQEDLRERIAALEHRRLERSQRLQRLQAGECHEVRWRLFEPADLTLPGAQPPALCRESSDRQATLASGHHVQILVRPLKPSYVYVLALGPYWSGPPLDPHPTAAAERSRRFGIERQAAGRRFHGNETLGAFRSEYRWMRLFGNDGATDLLQRPPRAGGNRLAGDDLLVFPGDAGASELFQHFLTLDSAPGCEFLVVALTPAPIAEVPLPSAANPAFPDRIEADLRAIFGPDSRLSTFQFNHA